MVTPSARWALPATDYKRMSPTLSEVEKDGKSWSSTVGMGNVKGVRIEGRRIEVSMDDGRTIHVVMENGMDPTKEEFTLVTDAFDDVVEGRGWKLERRKLVSPYLGRRPSPSVGYAGDPKLVEEVFGWNALVRGPDGFLDCYGASVLACAVAWAFVRYPEDLVCPPLPTVPLGKSSMGMFEQGKFGKSEDGHVMEQVPGIAYASAIDGHGGLDTMELLRSKSWRSFKKHLKGDIRAALVGMMREMDQECYLEYARARVKWEQSGNAQYVRDVASGRAREAKKQKRSMVPPGSTGACMAVAVVDESKGVLHAAVVGDCFVALRRTDGTLSQLPTHEAHSPWEMARTMLLGGFVAPPGNTWRVQGTMMPGRCFGDLGILPGAEPSLYSVSLEDVTHVLVASDGLYVPSYPKTLTPTGNGPKEDAKAWGWDLMSDNFDDRTLVVITLAKQQCEKVC